jgi:cytochrome P450
MINFIALGPLPRYWGDDSLVWRPNRCICQAPKSSGLDGEQIRQPHPGTFIPFASGPRVCPGAKFAQVQFVAVIARIFRQHRCSPLLLDGETIKDATKRVHEVVDDSNINLTLKMRNADRVRLIWEEIH